MIIIKLTPIIPERLYNISRVCSFIMFFNHALYVILGGALGTAMRFIVSRMFIDLKLINTLPSFFTYVTFVNVVGSFLMGILMAWIEEHSPSTATDDIKMFLAFGFLGGFTTFSAFSMDVLTLTQKGKIAEAIIYVFISVCLSIFLIFWGYNFASK